MNLAILVLGETVRESAVDERVGRVGQPSVAHISPSKEYAAAILNAFLSSLFSVKTDG
jgi:hypothetical protein